MRVWNACSEHAGLAVVACQIMPPPQTGHRTGGPGGWATLGSVPPHTEEHALASASSRTHSLTWCCCVPGAAGDASTRSHPRSCGAAGHAHHEGCLLGWQRCLHAIDDVGGQLLIIVLPFLSYPFLVLRKHPAPHMPAHPGTPLQRPRHSAAHGCPPRSARKAAAPSARSPHPRNHMFTPAMPGAEHQQQASHSMNGRHGWRRRESQSCSALLAAGRAGQGRGLPANCCILLIARVISVRLGLHHQLQLHELRWPVRRGWRWLAAVAGCLAGAAPRRAGGRCLHGCDLPGVTFQ
jgi:hypothetical protein